MKTKRIIPQFLLKGRRLVKGTRFSEHVDVGDPVSQAMIYDAQGAEEVCIVDIEASQQSRIIPPDLIRQMSLKCRLPIAAGGGIRSLDDARVLFASGADKIIINSGAIEIDSLVSSLAEEFGSQSVLVSLDVFFCEQANDWKVIIHSGKKNTNISVLDAIKHVIASGAGEIIVTSFDREGTLAGFDYVLYKKILPLIPVPFIAGGGAGCYEHLVRLFSDFPEIDACALGKMLSLRDYDIVRIKAFLRNRGIFLRDS